MQDPSYNHPNHAKKSQVDLHKDANNILNPKDNTSHIYKITPKFYLQIPSDPGVYLFLQNNKILYVGKAKNLRSRISTYFATKELLPKTKKLVHTATHLKIIQTLSEAEAFLLEASLIKLFMPPYNIQLKDDKTYPYLAISKIYIKNAKYKLSIKYYYKVSITRNLNIPNTIYFGPYPDPKQLKKVLRLLRQLFPFPTCSKTKFMAHLKQNRPCLYGQIGLCPAPCTQIGPNSKNASSRKSTTNFATMILNIRRLKQFLVMGQTAYIKKLEKKMKAYAHKNNFEKARNIRNLIHRINTLNFININPNVYIQNPNLKQDISKQIVRTIKKVFGYTQQQARLNIQIKEASAQKNAFRIECYDISTLFGQNSTSSMVVSINGNIRKDQFKHFKIRIMQDTSDFDMMRETLLRRLNHPEWGIPNMLLIDGGKQQVSSILKALLSIALDQSYATQNKTKKYVKSKLSKQQLLDMRNTDLLDLWGQFKKQIRSYSKINAHSSQRYINGNNSQRILLNKTSAHTFAQLLLKYTPIWGIFKPFDYFVTFIPHIKLLYQDNYSNYKQYLANSKLYLTEIQGNWLILRPKKQNFAIQHLRNLRDHAHDFAKNYHKLLRDRIK